MSTNTVPGLPLPDEIAAQHSHQLLQLLKSRLDREVLSFSEYMQIALYEPGLGYYMAGAQKFGKGGDFITAPEVSSLFGQCLAEQCREVLGLIGGNVLELGAGSGRLALNILTSLINAPPEHYYILEPSAELQQRQKQLLKKELADDLFSRIVWLDTLPENFEGICIANEVMDALPVERFAKHGLEVKQICVQLTDTGMALTNRNAPEDLSATVAAIEQELGIPFADGYESEISLMLSPWISSLGRAIKKGVLLLSDYGYPRQEYYLPERSNGTYACYYQHHFHDDVFYYPGLQDITAHVDFTRAVEAGSEAGFALLGYTSQTGFLLNSGISTLAARNIDTCQSELEQLKLAKEIKTLTLPGEMGERFQFMALGKNLTTALQGFSSQDLSHRL